MKCLRDLRIGQVFKFEFDGDRDWIYEVVGESTIKEVKCPKTHHCRGRIYRSTDSLLQSKVIICNDH